MVLKHKGSPSGPAAMEKVVATLPAPGAIAAASVGVSQVAVPGLRTTDVVTGSPRTIPGGIGVGYMRVVSADLLEVQYINQTIGAVDPGIVVYDVAILRFA